MNIVTVSEGLSKHSWVRQNFNENRNTGNCESLGKPSKDINKEGDLNLV